jgi:antitoxin VapB
MPLYIKDQDVADLARQVQIATKAKSLTDTVRTALQKEMCELKNRMPLSERLAPAIARADALGPSDPTFDMKKFTDEMWGE